MPTTTNSLSAAGLKPGRSDRCPPYGNGSFLRFAMPSWTFDLNRGNDLLNESSLNSLASHGPRSGKPCGNLPLKAW